MDFPLQLIYRTLDHWYLYCVQWCGIWLAVNIYTKCYSIILFIRYSARFLWGQNI